MIVAIDTSTDEASVAVYGGDGVRAEISWVAAGNHSRRLTPMLRLALDLAGVAPRDLQAVVAATGPGSFSGIRVGLSEAKGLALALEVPLVGVSTLEVLAFAACPCDRTVWALIPAGRGQMYAAAYGAEGPVPNRLGDYQVVATSDLTGVMQPGSVLVGPAATEVAAMLQVEGIDVLEMTLSKRLRRAGLLAELGVRSLCAGGEHGVDAVQPVYLRRSSAEEMRSSTGSSD